MSFFMQVANCPSTTSVIYQASLHLRCLLRLLPDISLWVLQLQSKDKSRLNVMVIRGTWLAAFQHPVTFTKERDSPATGSARRQVPSPTHQGPSFQGSGEDLSGNGEKKTQARISPCVSSTFICFHGRERDSKATDFQYPGQWKPGQDLSPSSEGKRDWYLRRRLKEVLSHFIFTWESLSPLVVGTQGSKPGVDC